MIGFLTAFFEDDNEDILLLTHLYERHYRLWQYKVRAIIRDSEVEDIIQDVLVNMIAKLPFLKKLSPVKQLAYISKSLENAAKKRAIFRDRVIVTDDVEQYSLELADDPATIYDQKATKQSLFRAIGRLKERHRDLLLYKYFEELPDEAIALLLNIQVSSIRSALARARRDLKAALHKENKDE